METELGERFRMRTSFLQCSRLVFLLTGLLVCAGISMPWDEAHGSPKRKTEEGESKEDRSKEDRSKQRGSKQGRKTVVMLEARARTNDATDAAQAVRGQFSDSSLHLEIVWVKEIDKLPLPQLALARKLAAANSSLAVFWYVYLPNGQGNLFIYLPKGDRLLIRELRSSVDSERWEVLAVIVRSTADAVRKGASLGKKWVASTGGARSARSGGSGAKGEGPRRKEVDENPGERGADTGVRKPEDTRPRPSPPRRGPAAEEKAEPGAGTVEKKRASATDERQWAAGLDAAYVLDGYSGDVGATHGFYVAASLHLFSSWAIVVDYRVQQQIKGSAGPVTTRISRHPIGLGVRYSRGLGRFRVGGRVSLVMDYSTYSTDVEPAASMEPAGKQGDFLFSVAAVARGSVAIAGPLSAFASLGMLVGLDEPRYVAEAADGNRSALVEPWPIKPLFLVGVSAQL
jgi:hypothetical protein